MAGDLHEPLLPHQEPKKTALGDECALFVGAATTGNAALMSSIRESVREARLSEGAFYAEAEALFQASLPEAANVPLLASFLRLEKDALPVLAELLAFKPDLAAAVGRGGGPVLFYAAAAGRADAVSSLLNAGANLHTKSGRLGQTALHAAAAAGHVDCVEILVREGASLLAETSEGFTAAALAQQAGHVSVVRFMHARGGFPVLQPPPQPRAPLRGFPRTAPLARTKLVVVERVVRERTEPESSASGCCCCCCERCCDVKCCDSCCSCRMCDTCCSTDCCDSGCSCRLCEICCGRGEKQGPPTAAALRR